MLVYDQQSATAPDSPPSGDTLSNYGSGQSFTPTLNSVGFVSLELISFTRDGAQVAVNLRSGSISGPVLGTTDPVSMTGGLGGNPVFLFSSPVSVTPGMAYYLQPILLSGSDYVLGASDSYNYAGGNEIIQGNPTPSLDLWFREGVVETPEPKTLALMSVAAVLLCLTSRKRKQV